MSERKEKNNSADRNPLEIKLDNLPANPGIYQFKDKAGKIIYVGKAKNLRNRVRSYFTSKPAGPRLLKMISLIKDVEIINTDSEVESLILEMNLIKQIKPRYNVNLKDDKSFPYIVITSEPYPRVFPTRKRINDGSKYFGPYADVGSMKMSLKMLRELFMIRTCSLNITQEAIEKKKFKICLEYHIQKCEGPCEGLVSRTKYLEMTAEIEKVLNGKTSTLMRELEEKMKAAAKNESFEEAALIRNRIDSLRVYTERQKIISEDFLDKDIINFVKEEDDACAMILNIRDGKVIGKRHYYIDTVEDKEPGEILENVIYRYYSENTFIPDEIHLPEEAGSTDFSMQALQVWFADKRGKKVEFLIPKRGEKVQLLAMVKTNARYMLDELKLQRLKREFIPNSVTSLKRDLRLSKLPRRIECYDISNIQGTDTVASMVVFYDGRPKKSDYRKFKIQSAQNEAGKPDDFASMREVIFRRFRKIAEKKFKSSPLTPLHAQTGLPKGEGNKESIHPLSPWERGTGGEGITTSQDKDSGGEGSTTSQDKDSGGEGSTTSQDKVVKPNIPYQTEKARALRKKETPAEKLLWNALRNRKFNNFKFRRQHPIGYYIVDFYSDEFNLIIEIDGSIHDLEENIEYDKNRQAELEAAGYRILRFTNNEVINNLTYVFKKIMAVMPSPLTPLPKGEGKKDSIHPLTPLHAQTGLPKGEGNKESIHPLSPWERGTGGEGITTSQDKDSGGEGSIENEIFTDSSFDSLPDLIVIDGGKGQLSSAVKVLTDLALNDQNIIGLAKRLEEVFIPGSSEAQSIPKTSSGLKLLQRVRDEAHRFAITFHRTLRDKRTLKSELEDIKGIGKATSLKLLKEFGSVEKIREMIRINYSEFQKSAGNKTAERLKEYWSKT